MTKKDYERLDLIKNGVLKPLQLSNKKYTITQENFIILYNNLLEKERKLAQ